MSYKCVIDLVKHTTVLQCTFLLVNVGRDSKTALYLQDDLSKVQFWSGYYPPKNSSKAPLPASPTSSSKSLLICNLQHITHLFFLKAKQIYLQLVPQIHYAEPDLCVFAPMCLLSLPHVFDSEFPLTRKCPYPPS